MRKMTVLGASALLIAGLMGSPAAAFAAPVAGAPVATTAEATCPKDGKVDVSGEQTTMVVTAEPGYVITGYCVKAGSAEAGDGPENVVVDPPTAAVTISHSSGKAISHYTLITVEAGTEPSPSPSPSDDAAAPAEECDDEAAPAEGGDDAAAPVEECDDAAAPAEETTEVTEASAAPVEDADDTTPAEEEPPVLAATGASTAIGFTLIALALVGGGVTLLVLRRKGVLGS